MVAFHGQMGMFTRALTYILSHGADGLRQVAEDAVLNANYILRSLEDVLDAPFAASGPVHARGAVQRQRLRRAASPRIDLAKALIDEGFHPMTMYFPLVVHGAMLVEPTETEIKASLDQFIMAVRSIAERAKAGDESLKAAPVCARAGGSTRRWPRGSRCWPTRSRSPRRRPSKRKGGRSFMQGQVHRSHQTAGSATRSPIGIIVVVMALRMRRMGKMRPLKLETLVDRPAFSTW